MVSRSWGETAEDNSVKVQTAALCARARRQQPEVNKAASQGVNTPGKLHCSWQLLDTRMGCEGRVESESAVISGNAMRERARWVDNAILQ